MAGNLPVMILNDHLLPVMAGDQPDQPSFTCLPADQGEHPAGSSPSQRTPQSSFTFIDQFLRETGRVDQDSSYHATPRDFRRRARNNMAPYRRAGCGKSEKIRNYPKILAENKQIIEQEEAKGTFIKREIRELKQEFDRLNYILQHHTCSYQQDLARLHISHNEADGCGRRFDFEWATQSACPSQ